MVGKRPPLLPAGLLALLLLASSPASGEVKPSVTLSAKTTLARLDDEAALYSSAKGSLQLASASDPNVKGLLQLDAEAAQDHTVSLPRAYIKVRFPWFRSTLGKTRTTWGEGMLFNAGDVVFGSMELKGVDISAQELRDETDWLWLLYLPLGSFSFLEAVLVPYAGRAGTLVEDLESLAEPVALGDLSAGMRAGTKVAGLTLEGGCFTHGGDNSLRPYLSIHGHLLVDWYASSSLDIPHEDPEWSRADRWWRASLGFFHLLRFESGSLLSLRLEAALRGDGRWEEPVEEEEAPVLALFPEIIFSPLDTLSLELRSLISPVDLSCLVWTGVRWNIYQGLNVLAQATAMMGEERDLYGWDRDYGVTVTLGMEYVY